MVSTMNKYTVLSLLCIISGIALLGYGISVGQGKIYWVLIIPIIEGTGVFSVLGILLLVAGIILFMFSFTLGSYRFVGYEADEEELGYIFNTPYGRPMGQETDARATAGKTKKVQKSQQPPTHHEREKMQDGPYASTKPTIRTGGVLFIGPIPIIWGSDKRIAYIMALVSVVLVVIFLIFALSVIF